MTSTEPILIRFGSNSEMFESNTLSNSKFKLIIPKIKRFILADKGRRHQPYCSLEDISSCFEYFKINVIFTCQNFEIFNSIKIFFEEMNTKFITNLLQVEYYCYISEPSSGNSNNVLRHIQRSKL